MESGEFPVVKIKREIMKRKMEFTALSFSPPFPAFPLNPASSVAISLRPAGSWCGCSLWPFPQFLRQCCAVNLQCSRSSTHTDTLETPISGQQRLVLHQPVPGLCSYQQGRPGSGPLLQLEDRDRGVWRQHRYGTHTRTSPGHVWSEQRESECSRVMNSSDRVHESAPLYEVNGVF